MSDLRNKLIRLAHEKPELRKHLLPLIKQSNFKKKNKKFMGVLKNMLMEKVKKGELQFAEVNDVIDTYSKMNNTDIAKEWKTVLPKKILKSLTSQQEKRLNTGV